MDYRDLANRLIAARTLRERRRLLKTQRTIADVGLARELRDICYAAWSTEPATARRAQAALDSLTELNNDEEIAAIHSWVAGIAAITNGELETAVGCLEKAVSGFKALGREHESAQPMVAELIALAMLGRYDAAVRAGKRALRIFEKYGDELAAGKIELNLSNISSRRERHREAEKYGTSALERFKSIGETQWQTMSENSLANTYTDLNDFRRAQEFYTAALANAKGAGMTVTEAEIEASLGTLELFRGRYAEALRLFERSRRKYAELSMPHQSAVADLEIADIYTALNLNSEAIEIYRSVAGSFRRLKLRAEEARARANYGRAAAKIGKYSLAANQLETAKRLYELEANEPAAAAVMLTIAGIERSLGHNGSAKELVAAARSKLSRSENPRHILAADWLEAELLCEAGENRAKSALENVAERAAALEQVDFVRAAFISLGKLDVAGGQFDSAKHRFTKAVEIVESLRAPLPAEEFSIAFMAERLEPFREMFKISMDARRYDEALVWLERMRSRSLAEAVTSVEVAEDDDPLSQKLSALREELNWNYRRRDGAEDSNRPKIDRSIARLEKQISVTTRQIGSSVGVWSRRKPATFDLEQIHRLHSQLGNYRAMIEFVEIDGALGAFVLAGGDIHFTGMLASSVEIRNLVKSMRQQFDSLKHGSARLTGLIDVINRRTDQILASLYSKLLAPLQSNIGRRGIVVVPSGPLHYVPFHALQEGGRYLIQDHEVTYAPSAAVWSSLPKKQLPDPAKSMLIGFADEAIPLVDSEISAIAGTMPHAEVYVGSDATFPAYLGGSSNKELIHISCHGEFRSDNPMFSSLHLADGWVTVNDIARQRLRAKLVTLSACETGLNEVAAGDEILGLARGFLSAGAANIVLSLWTVNDAATAELMQDFYAAIQRGKDVSASLQEAQTLMIDKGVNPYFWAPFVLIGG